MGHRWLEPHPLRHWAHQTLAYRLSTWKEKNSRWNSTTKGINCEPSLQSQQVWALTQKNGCHPETLDELIKLYRCTVQLWMFCWVTVDVDRLPARADINIFCSYNTNIGKEGRWRKVRRPRGRWEGGGARVDRRTEKKGGRRRGNEGEVWQKAQHFYLKNKHVAVCCPPLFDGAHDCPWWGLHLNLLQTAREATTVATEWTRQMDHFPLQVVQDLHFEWTAWATALPGTTVSVYKRERVTSINSQSPHFAQIIALKQTRCSTQLLL